MIKCINLTTDVKDLKERVGATEHEVRAGSEPGIRKSSASQMKISVFSSKELADDYLLKFVSY